jgi:ubiquinone/menaquinone biosynthesis C-methylase UbiE
MIAKNTLLDIEMILNQLPEKTDARVADLGCGNFGFFVFPLARLVGKRGKVYAADIMKSSVEEIKARARTENLPQIETVWCDLEKIGATGIKKGSLAAVFLVNTLFQAALSLDMLKESERILKAGGLLIIADWDDLPAPPGPPAAQRVKKDKLITATAKLNLELVREFNPGAYHYGLVFKKK